VLAVSDLLLKKKKKKKTHKKTEKKSVQQEKSASMKSLLGQFVWDSPLGSVHAHAPTLKSTKGLWVDGGSELLGFFKT